MTACITGSPPGRAFACWHPLQVHVGPQVHSEPVQTAHAQPFD